MNDPVMYPSGTEVEYIDGFGTKHIGSVFSHLQDVDKAWYYLIDERSGRRIIVPINKALSTEAA